ncbi:hypothetical protein DVA81_19565, partial [Acinetobacter baumannii]
DKRYKTATETTRPQKDTKDIVCHFHSDADIKANTFREANMLNTRYFFCHYTVLFCIPDTFRKLFLQ